MGEQIALCEIFLQVQFSTLALLLSCQTGNGSFTFVNSGGTIKAVTYDNGSKIKRDA